MLDSQSRSTTILDNSSSTIHWDTWTTDLRTGSFICSYVFSRGKEFDNPSVTHTLTPHPKKIQSRMSQVLSYQYVVFFFLGGGDKKDCRVSKNRQLLLLKVPLLLTQSYILQCLCEQTHTDSTDGFCGQIQFGNRPASNACSTHEAQCKSLNYQKQLP